EKLNAIAEAIADFFKSLWDEIANFFGGSKASAREIEGDPYEINLANASSHDDDRHNGNRDDDDDDDDKEDNNDDDRDDKGSKNRKSEKYYGDGRGPKDWDDFYEWDDDHPFNEKPDYVKKPIRKAKYQYDEAGNRIEQNEDGKITKYRYNELNELVETGDKKYYYDANGNLVEKETREGTIKYDYATDNRLKGVYYPDGSQVEYEYDALRRKSSRTQGYYHLSRKGNGWGWSNREDWDDWKDWDEWDDWGKWYDGEKNSLKKWKGKPFYEETTQYLYDGLNVLKEYGEHGQPLAQYYQGSDHTIARKMFGYHGRKQEGYEGNVQSKGGLLYYHEDALGNILDVTDRSGEKRASYSYDAFGNLFSHMAAPYNAVGFTGKSYDAKAG
ncbi:hypothetical protein CVD23_21545, partial [Bacillus sp. V33-4]